MRFIPKRLHRDIELIYSQLFLCICQRCNKKHFTRNRKMPLVQLILTMLNRRGLTLSLELRKWRELMEIESSISKVGYLKQRMKLNPEALMVLSRHHNRGLYEDGEMESWNGYYFFAADGSGLNVPTTQETLEYYGTSSRKDTKPQAALGLSCIYDMINHTILECSVNDCKFNEMAEAYKQWKKTKETVGERKSVLVMDRGYPASAYLLEMVEKDEKFVVRLSATNFKKEQQAMQTEDEWVDIVFDKSRMTHYRGSETERKMKEKGSIRLRFVRIPLENGNIEYLATNLSEKEFSTRDMGRIYNLRWTIETVYDVLKNNLEIENFTGTKPVLIEQDIYSCVYLCNLVQDLIADAEEEQKRENIGKYKHPMTINKTYAVGVLKEELIRVIVEPDPRKKEERFNRMLEEVKNQVVPIRDHRHFQRTKGKLAGKYSNTHKRSY